jgi:hypothetical protein
MGSQISGKKPDNFDIRDDETYSDYKRRKSEEKGLQGMGQKTVKKTDGWTEAQKRGKRSRNKGMRKQNEARKQLRIPNAKFRSNMGNEENWRGNLRFEVKAGKQIESIWNKFKKMEEQSDVNNPEYGTGRRPFVGVIKPDGTSDGLVMFKISDIENVVTGFVMNWEEYE